jgi:hypothetical protein
LVVGFSGKPDNSTYIQVPNQHLEEVGIRGVIAGYFGAVDSHPDVISCRTWILVNLANDRKVRFMIKLNPIEKET